MSDVWVVLIIITIFIISRELFIWLVRKMITWTRLLWNKMNVSGIDEGHTSSVHEVTRKIDNKIAKAIKKTVLEPQYEYIKKCNENPSYWGDTGMWVSLAVNEIANTMDSVPCDVGMEEKEWIDAAISKLMGVHEKFRSMEDDPDGSGSATFHEAISALHSLPSKTKIIESKELENESF